MSCASTRATTRSICACAAAEAEVKVEVKAEAEAPEYDRERAREERRQRKAAEKLAEQTAAMEAQIHALEARAGDPQHPARSGQPGGRRGPHPQPGVDYEEIDAELHVAWREWAEMA